jgi:hypothetical protein
LRCNPMVGPPYTAECNMPVWRLDSRRVASSLVEMLKRIGAGQLRDASKREMGVLGHRPHALIAEKWRRLIGTHLRSRACAACKYTNRQWIENNPRVIM